MVTWPETEEEERRRRLREFLDLLAVPSGTEKRPPERGTLARGPGERRPAVFPGAPTEAGEALRRIADILSPPGSPSRGVIESFTPSGLRAQYERRTFYPQTGFEQFLDALAMMPIAPVGGLVGTAGRGLLTQARVAVPQAARALAQAAEATVLGPPRKATRWARIRPEGKTPVAQPGRGPEPPSSVAGDITPPRPSPLAQAEAPVGPKAETLLSPAREQITPGAAGGPTGEPPSGTIPPKAAAEGQSPAQPSAIGGAIQQAKQRARAVIAQDKPGAISNLMQRIPGVKQARTFERPALELPDYALEAHVAKEDVLARESTQAFSTRQEALTRLKAAFGQEAVEGGKTKVPFAGTAEEAKFSGTGTILDIAQRTHLYQLTPEQRAALEWVEQRNAGSLQGVNQGYGTGIGQFRSKQGVLHLPNVDASESIIEQYGGRATAIARAGRLKTRLWDTAAEREAHDPSFKPMTDIRLLLGGMDEAKTGAAARRTFQELLGGKSRLEVMRETHPDLAARMEGLRDRLTSLRGTKGYLADETQTAIDDFLASPLEGQDMTAVRDALDIKITRGKNVGKDVRAVQQEINTVRGEIAALRSAWEAANLKGYTFVQEGIYRYFPTADAPKIRELTRTESNVFISFIEDWRATKLGGDTSPITGVQAPLGVLFDPYGSAKGIIGGVQKSVREKNILRAFSINALAADVRADPDDWLDFASYMGRGVRAGTPQEFAGGWLRMIPGYSKVNEAMYIAVMRQSKRLWDDLASSLIKDGVAPDMAKAAAADQVSKVYPLIAPAKLGQSQARAALLRSTATSISFIRKPAEMILDAHSAYFKMATFQKLTPKEKLAARLFTMLLTSMAAASVTTSLLSAEKRGRTWHQAVKDVTDPNSPRFASMVFGDDSIPVGGPYRALIRAAWPREVADSPVPIPFAGLPFYLTSRITPAVKTQLELFKNSDFFGKKIVYGKFPENIIRFLAYELEGAAPISATEVMRGVRTAAPTGGTAKEAAVQFLGASIRPGRAADMKYDWRDDLDAYEDIPTSELERVKRGVRVDRLEYRKRNPEVDAKLFITGEVTALQSNRAAWIAAQLIRDNRLDPESIRGIKEVMEQAAEWQKAGLRAPPTSYRQRLLMSYLGQAQSRGATSSGGLTNRRKTFAEEFAEVEEELKRRQAAQVAR